jgi:hypothetical protein
LGRSDAAGDSPGLAYDFQKGVRGYTRLVERSIPVRGLGAGKEGYAGGSDDGTSYRMTIRFMPRGNAASKAIDKENLQGRKDDTLTIYNNECR